MVCFYQNVLFHFLNVLTLAPPSREAMGANLKCDAFSKYGVKTGTGASPFSHDWINFVSGQS